MDISSWFARETWQLDKNEWLIVISASLLVGLATTTAWATPAATFLLLLVPFVLALLNGYRPQACQPYAIEYAFAVLAAFVALSVMWSVDPSWSAKSLWPLAGILLVLPCLRIVASGLPPVWLGHFCRAVLVTYCIILTYSLVEETTRHAIKHALFWPFQAVQSVDGQWTIDWSHKTKVVPYRTNWNMTVLCFLVWPVLIMLRSQVGRRDYRIIRMLILAALAATVLQSFHQAAIVALFIGAAAYGVARISVRTALAVLAGFWVLAFVAAVPIANQLYAHGLHTDSRLPLSFRHRIVFWKATADEFAKRPLLGVGIGASHPLNEARKPDAKVIKGTPFLFETGTHPHNIYLQTLYELGVVGALLLMLFGLMVLYVICHHSSTVAAPYLLGLFATWASQSASSFGLLEAWYVFALMFSICCFVAVNKLLTAERMDLGAYSTMLPTGGD